MYTLEATRHANVDRTTWVALANGQYATVFFFLVFFARLTHTSHCTSDMDQINEGSKRVVPLKKVLLGSLNNLSLNCR